MRESNNGWSALVLKGLLHNGDIIIVGIKTHVFGGTLDSVNNFVEQKLVFYKREKGMYFAVISLHLKHLSPDWISVVLMCILKLKEFGGILVY